MMCAAGFIQIKVNNVSHNQITPSAMLCSRSLQVYPWAYTVDKLGLKIVFKEL